MLYALALHWNSLPCLVMMSGMIPATAEVASRLPLGDIADFCRRHGICRAAVFGSALRSDFHGESDLDVLVEFEPGRTPGLAFFAMQEELSQILGRRADFNTSQDISAHYRDKVLAEAQPLYVAT